MVSKKWDLISIASIPLIMTLGNSMLIPVLPHIAEELQITSFQVSLVITVYAVVAILLIPVAGFLSDRYGRKRVILPALTIAGLGGAVSAGGAWWLDGGAAYGVILAGRFLQGIGAAGAAPIVLPLVGDMFKSDGEISKGLGVIETSNTFGKVLSPILGSALALWVWFAPFVAIPVFCAISILLVAFLVKTPKGQDEKEEKTYLREFVHSILAILKKKGRWLYAIFAVGGISMFLVFGVLFYLSNTLEEAGIEGIGKGAILAIPLGALCLASYLTGKWIGEHKKRMKRVSVFGMVLLTGAIFGIAWFGNMYLWIGLLVVGGFGIGVTLPCLDALITEGIEKKQRGTVTSLYSSMRFIGVSLGPPVVSLLTARGHAVVFFSLAGVCLAAVLITIFFIRPKQDISNNGGKGGGEKEQGISEERERAKEPAPWGRREKARI